MLHNSIKLVPRIFLFYLYVIWPKQVHSAKWTEQDAQRGSIFLEPVKQQLCRAYRKQAAVWESEVWEQIQDLPGFDNNKPGRFRGKSSEFPNRGNVGGPGISFASGNLYKNTMKAAIRSRKQINNNRSVAAAMSKP